MALPLMKTPNEFIDYYYNQLKTDLGNDNIRLSKTGLMGFLLNILGNTQFDNKRYYDALFTESFPALSLDDKNLRFHADTHGFTIPMAQAAVITNGTFTLDFNLLPTPSNNLASRVISFGTSSANVSVNSLVEIDTNGIIYTVDSSYLITAKVVTGNVISYYYEAINGISQNNGGIQISSPSIPIVNASQYISTTHVETIPFYPYSSHYTILLSMGISEMIFEISAFITLPTVGSSPMIMTVDTNKSKYTGSDNVIFYSILPDNSILIELGSGTKGVKITEGTSVSIIVKTTKGIFGNISPPGIQDAKISTVSSTAAISAIVTDTYSDGSVSSKNIELKKFLTPDIISASGGVDSLTGPSLQDGLVRYIQTRDSIVSKTDYDNILFNIFKYYAISFNKSKLSNNTISLYVPLFDNYSNVVSSSTVNFTKDEFELSVFNDTSNNIRTVYEPVKLTAAQQYVSPFYYKYDFLFNMYYAYLLIQAKTYNYASVSSKDFLGNPVSLAVSNLPDISLTLTYHHNLIAPYTIISISSYEDITRFLGAGFTSVKFTNLNFSYTTGTASIPASSNHVSNIVKRSGIQDTLISNLTTSPITSIILANTANFPLTGSVSIGTEDFTYTNKNDTTNTLTGIGRGANATVIAAHSSGASVFDITIDNSKIEFVMGRIISTLSNIMTSISTTLTIADSSLFPPNGVVIIGSEEISYSNITGNSLNGIIRGLNTTTAMNHAVGDLVREKLSSSTPQLSEIMGLIDTPTQIEVNLNNVIPAIGGSTGSGFSNTYLFNITQVININDNLQVKQYNLNGITTGLTAQVAVGDTSISVTSTLNFPANGLLRIDNEEMSYSAITPNGFTGVVKGINNTTDASHLIGSNIIQVTSLELGVPVVDQTIYNANSLTLVDSMMANYQSLSLPANRAISDDVQLKLLNTSHIPLNFLNLTVANGSSYVSTGATSLQVNAPNGLLLPLKVGISLVLNKVLITAQSANITSDIDTLIVDIAHALSNNFTGTQIRISDADLIIIVKQIPYVDDANIIFTDSSSVPIVKNEINVLPEVQILSSMTKIERIDYVPVLWHWDINNINVTYTVS